MDDSTFSEMSRSARAVIWFGFYVLCWLAMGLSCRVDLPPNCRRASEPMEVLTELPVLLVFALSQAFVCKILDDERFESLVAKPYFPAVVIASGLVISTFSRLKEFEDLQDSGGEFSTVQAVVSILLILFVILVLLYHLRLAWETLPGNMVFVSRETSMVVPPPPSLRSTRNQLLEYCCLLSAVVAHAVLFGAFANARGDSWGFHYVLVAWMLSLVARFDDALSMVWLGLTTGVFLQGVGAYSLHFLTHDH